MLRRYTDVIKNQFNQGKYAPAEVLLALAQACIESYDSNTQHKFFTNNNIDAEAKDEISVALCKVIIQTTNKFYFPKKLIFFQGDIEKMLEAVAHEIEKQGIHLDRKSDFALMLSAFFIYYPQFKSTLPENISSVLTRQDPKPEVYLEKHINNFIENINIALQNNDLSILFDTYDMHGTVEILHQVIPSRFFEKMINKIIHDIENYFQSENAVMNINKIKLYHFLLYYLIQSINQEQQQKITALCIKAIEESSYMNKTNNIESKDRAKSFPINFPLDILRLINPSFISVNDKKRLINNLILLLKYDDEDQEQILLALVHLKNLYQNDQEKENETGTAVIFSILSAIKREPIKKNVNFFYMTALTQLQAHISDDLILPLVETLQAQPTLGLGLLNELHTRIPEEIRHKIVLDILSNAKWTKESCPIILLDNLKNFIPKNLALAVGEFLLNKIHSDPINKFNTFRALFHLLDIFPDDIGNRFATICLSELKTTKLGTFTHIKLIDLLISMKKYVPSSEYPAMLKQVIEYIKNKDYREEAYSVLFRMAEVLPELENNLIAYLKLGYGHFTYHFGVNYYSYAVNNIINLKKFISPQRYLQVIEFFINEFLTPYYAPRSILTTISLNTLLDEKTFKKLPSLVQQAITHRAEFYSTYSDFYCSRYFPDYSLLFASISLLLKGGKISDNFLSNYITHIKNNTWWLDAPKVAPILKMIYRAANDLQKARIMHQLLAPGIQDEVNLSLATSVRFAKIFKLAYFIRELHNIDIQQRVLTLWHDKKLPMDLVKHISSFHP